MKENVKEFTPIASSMNKSLNNVRQTISYRYVLTADKEDR